jgi:DNA modification methylase
VIKSLAFYHQTVIELITMNDYEEFIESKSKVVSHSGIHVESSDINPMLFPFQRDIVKWALGRGKAALFEDCGLGKSFQQLEWARHIPGPVLILAPLAVASQTIAEGRKFHIELAYARNQIEVGGHITITNYEHLDKFDASYFAGVVLDESSILKNFTGKMRNAILDAFEDTPYKLACTATPSPNDYEELGNHSEFINVMSRTNMLAKYFINDANNTGTWRIKGHAVGPFWDWVASWAVGIGKPSDIGHDDTGYILPALTMKELKVEGSYKKDFELIPTGATSATELYKSLRMTTIPRSELAAQMVNESTESWIIWCNTNDESAALAKLIPDAVEVKGADSIEVKETRISDFVNGRARVIISKPSITGLGLNFQHCHKVIFVSITYSYEDIYQAIRRAWRFGQKHPVDVYIITADNIEGVVDSIKAKKAAHESMMREMVSSMTKTQTENLRGRTLKHETNETETIDTADYTAHNNDCIEAIKGIPDNSIHYSLFSPPFASLFTYSDSARDMGNCENQDEFLVHFKFLVSELYRVTMPGRLLSFHCMNLTTTKWKDGHIGLIDFRGNLIRMFQDAGFIYHSEVCIWKDPLVQATRTKALTLAHKQISKDAAMCGQGLPDYLVTMRKPGDNPEPVAHGRGFEFYVGERESPNPGNKQDDPRINKYSHQVWQRYASPVWFDIRQTRVLNASIAREDKDEKHMCPLQLDVIERAIHLWTNEGDTVLSPFMGIGSEGVGALQLDRKFIGIELKTAYFKQAIKNLNDARKQVSLFDTPEAE